MAGDPQEKNRAGGTHFCNTDGLLPHVITAVHVHCAEPLGGLTVVVLGLTQAAFRFQMLCQKLVRFLEQFLAVKIRIGVAA
jgi:hypothetical protein